MIFDTLKFYRDHGVPSLSTGHKHCQTGWVQTVCPFCKGNPGWHLGYHLRDGFFSCWRCGGHSVKEVVKTILGCSWHEAGQTIGRYRGLPKNAGETKTSGFLPRKKSLVLPYGCGELQAGHRNYLIKRGFNPDELVQQWGLQGTGNHGSYAFRIIAPIYQYGQLVSYQGRDWTGKAELRYKACRKGDEIIDHKHCLYGLDFIDSSVVVLVEGITDAWRLGPGAVCSFGIKYRIEQAKKLRRFDKVFTFFDPDPQAEVQSERIAAYLAMYRKEVIQINIKKKGMDPAELPQAYARDLMKELLQED